MQLKLSQKAPKVSADTVGRTIFLFSSRSRHTRWTGDWSSDVCSSELQLVVELGLRRPSRPGLARLEEDGDLILVAVLVAGLDADDVGDRLPVVGRGARDARGWRRVARVIAFELTGESVLVFVFVGRRRVALRVGRGRVGANPGLHLRTGEHGAAVGVVDDRHLTAAAGCFRREA